jgi:hypothetical protein
VVSEWQRDTEGCHNRKMLQAKVRAVASFGDDPTKIEIILPPGDPQVMLADVTTKPNFQLFGTALSYSYPEEELAKRPAHPANTLIEIGVAYCFRAMVRPHANQNLVMLHTLKRSVPITCGSNTQDFDANPFSVRGSCLKPSTSRRHDKKQDLKENVKRHASRCEAAH